MLSNRKEIHIEWGDCDPAGIVYFPRFFEYFDACTNALFEKAGLKGWEKVTAHGLRRGGAQAIADGGGDPTSQGRWQEGSAVVKREYLDRATNRRDNPWLKLARPKTEGEQPEA